jgi:hypothetical protein
MKQVGGNMPLIRFLWKIGRCLVLLKMEVTFCRSVWFRFGKRFTQKTVTIERTRRLVYTRPKNCHVLQFGNNLCSFYDINAVSNNLLHCKEKVFGDSFRCGTYLNNIATFWGVTPWYLVDTYQSFGRTCSLHLQCLIRVSFHSCAPQYDTLFNSFL